MQVNITGRNLDITPALRSFTTEKMAKLNHHSPTITTVDVILHLEHLDHVAEANLHFMGTDINATAKADDMYKALDELIDKLLALITKHKEKTQR